MLPKPQKRRRIDWGRAEIIELHKPRCRGCGAILPAAERVKPTGDGAMQRYVVCRCGAAYILIVE